MTDEITMSGILRRNGFSGWKDLAEFLKRDVKFYEGCTGLDKFWGCGYSQDSRCKEPATKRPNVVALIKVTLSVDDETAEEMFRTLNKLGWIENWTCWDAGRVLFNV